MKILYLSGYTENRLNNLIEAEEVKADWPARKSAEVRIGPWTAH